MKAHIRHATDDDFAALLALDQACFEKELAYDATELSHMMSRPGAEAIVLEEDGDIAGFLLLDVNRRRRRATVITLDVRADKRRKGYASALMERGQALLSEHGVSACDLQVDTQNEGAVAFYRKHGFEVSRRLPGYYSSGRDAWQMVKKLPQGDGA